MNNEGLTKVSVIPPVSEPPPNPNQRPAAKPPETAINQSVKPMTKPKKKRSMMPVVLVAVVILAGVASGYALSVIKPQSQPTTQTTTNAPASADAVEEGKAYGAKEGQTFLDKAEGVLVKGGIEGEGSHHLMRDGGPARNVYLTSSVLDLDTFVNHLVEVDGETFNAQKAGWLMDVGMVKVMKLNAPKPFEEATPADMPAE